MRSLYFLVPGTRGKLASGGFAAEIKTMEMAQQLCRAELVTYRQRESGTLFLDELLPQIPPQRAIFVVGWGFDVPQLINRLKGHHVIHHAHSSGYGFRLPSHIPIVTVSRNTMGYWGQYAPASPIYYLPNQIGDEFRNQNRDRDIDVLVQTRKSSEYLLQQLVPALQQHCRVEILNGYVEDLVGLFNRTKVYLYDSAEYWAQYRVTEGFGLPPMEALACGCTVFSSVNSALSDYLDPGFNCHKIAVYSQEYDVQQILQVLEHPPEPLPESFFADYRRDRLIPRLHTILAELNTFFDHQEQYPANIPELTPGRLWKLRLKRIWRKLSHSSNVGRKG